MDESGEFQMEDRDAKFIEKKTQSLKLQCMSLKSQNSHTSDTQKVTGEKVLQDPTDLDQNLHFPKFPR